MNQVREFLENLMNRTIGVEEKIRLTSAQIARFLMWTGKNGMKVDVALIRQEFSLKLLESYFSNSNYVTPVRHGAKTSSELGVAGIGIDIQLVEEIFPRSEPLEALELKKIFTSYEIEYAMAKENIKLTLSGIFSLKESLIKSGAEHDSYLDLEILHDGNGAPIVHGFLVSISHSEEYVTSVALKIVP